MKYLTLLLLAASVFCGKATLAQGKKSPEQILMDVTEKTKSYSSIKVSFTYNMDNPEAKIHESQKGVLMIKGDKYRLTIAEQLVICDGQTVWTYLEDANEVQINSVEEDPDVITPTRLLTSYNENYKAKLIGEEKKGATWFYMIELKPIEDKNFSRIELSIEKELLRIMRIAIQDKGGSTYTYIVNEFSPDVLFRSTDFSFNIDDHPGVEVIDMR
jgi:outer membrane lipoprotein-sorting protein